MLINRLLILALMAMTTSGTEIPESVLPKGTVVVSGRRSWSASELEAIARGFLTERSDDFRDAKVSNITIRVYVRGQNLCVVNYFQGFGRRSWEVTIGKDGKGKKVDTAIAVE